MGSTTRHLGGGEDVGREDKKNCVSLEDATPIQHAHSIKKINVKTHKREIFYA